MTMLLSLALAMLVGLLFTRLAKLVHLPNVTAYLVAGLLIGPSCLGLVPSGVLKSMDIISTVALGFIAFSIGGEFKLSSMKMLGSRVITITFFQAMTAVLMVDAVLLICGFPAAEAADAGRDCRGHGSRRYADGGASIPRQGPADLHASACGGHG